MTDEINDPEEKTVKRNAAEGTVAEEGKGAGQACGQPAEGKAGAGGWLDAFIRGIRNRFTGQN